jgi:hypothetical protein
MLLHVRRTKRDKGFIPFSEPEYKAFAGALHIIPPTGRTSVMEL